MKVLIESNLILSNLVNPVYFFFLVFVLPSCVFVGENSF